MDKIIVSTGLSAFGGSRIAEGASSANLWSDGVVLASAWSQTDPALDGQVFTFRGTIKRTPRYWAGAPRWYLRDESGEYVADFATRREAVYSAEAFAKRAAFRYINGLGNRA